MLGGSEPDSGHQLARIVEAVEVTNLGDDERAMPHMVSTPSLSLVTDPSAQPAN